MTETQMILKILENNLKLNPNEKRSFLDIMKKLCVKYSSLGLPNVMLQSLLGCETDVTKLGIKIEDRVSVKTECLSWGAELVQLGKATKDVFHTKVIDIDTLRKDSIEIESFYEYGGKVTSTTEWISLNQILGYENTGLNNIDLIDITGL
jgi:hypothetical protein